MGFTEQEAFSAMGEALVARGLASQEQVDSDLATQPFYKPAEQATSAVDTINLQADAVDPHAQSLDQSIYAPPASPGGYRFLPPPPGTAYDAAQAQATARASHEIGLPASTASYADKLFSAAMQAPPDPAQLAASHQQGMAQLHRTFGADTPKVIATAQAEFARMARSAERSGLGNHPMLISQLWFNARAKGRA